MSNEYNQYTRLLIHQDYKKYKLKKKEIQIKDKMCYFQLIINKFL